MISAMTDYQYNSIIEMVDIILEGSRDIDEARQKIARLKRDNYNGSRKENDEKEEN